MVQLAVTTSSLHFNPAIIIKQLLSSRNSLSGADAAYVGIITRDVVAKVGKEVPGVVQGTNACPFEWRRIQAKYESSHCSSISFHINLAIYSYNYT
jgi:hypothetical protein